MSDVDGQVIQLLALVDAAIDRGRWSSGQREKVEIAVTYDLDSLLFSAELWDGVDVSYFGSGLTVFDALGDLLRNPSLVDRVRDIA